MSSIKKDVFVGEVFCGQFLEENFILENTGGGSDGTDDGAQNLK